MSRRYYPHPLNPIAGRILKILFKNKLDIHKREDLEKLFTLSNLIKYKIYKFKVWIWKLRSK